MLSCANDGTRGVSALKRKESSPSFNRNQSTALFVGVQQFHDDTLNPVPFAADDAVDMAYAFVLERRASLVLPQNVVIALAGDPVKKESRERLRKLRELGAIVQKASRKKVVALIEELAERAGRDGIFIISVASHGFNKDGVPYVLAEDSSFRDHSTWISTSRITDLAATSRATRSLIFIDACRERVIAGARGALTISAAPLIRSMNAVQGQAVFFAAAANQYSFDDPVKKNGVFTSGVVNALRCNAAVDARGIVTAGTLADYVERYVLDWIQKHRDPTVRKATQVSWDGKTKLMPLSLCTRPPAPASVKYSGSTFEVFAEDGARLWSRTLDHTITAAETADLDGDSFNEVVLLANGSIVVWNADAEELWRKGAGIDRFVIGSLFRKLNSEIVATSERHLSIFSYDGSSRKGYEHPKSLLAVLIAKPTARHDARLILGAVDGVLMLNPNKPGKAVWNSPVGAIRKLEAIDYDSDGKRDICVTTGIGKVYLDFKGTLLALPGRK
jgi:hypothetical protein